MIFGSVCSGIEAASVAWNPLGWKTAWVSEIDKFANTVLRHHYPEVENLGDFTQITAERSGHIDLLVGGTPCQAFSVAGRRLGLDDPRGNLTLEFLRLAGRLNPRWIVWENVPGVLSIDGGRTFGTVLGALAELGYGFAYRVLDAQFFGVPQRRRRMFVVGYLGDWRGAAAVLFEQESLYRDTQESGQPRKRTFADYTISPRECRTRMRNRVSVGFYSTGGAHGVDATIEGVPPIKVGSALEIPSCPAVVIVEQGIYDGWTDNPHPSAVTVRKLTPKECERAQGFEDDYTLVEFDGKSATDGLRYKAIGNSMAVPVMRWIGQRIEAVDRIMQMSAMELVA